VTFPENPRDRVPRENEAAAVAVAATLAAGARHAGGTLIASAAELHAMGSGPHWPRSALELDRRVLPGLARRGPLSGATVAPVGGMAGRRWHIAAAPLPPALVPPLVAFAWPPAPVAAIAAAPTPAPVARAVAAVKPDGTTGPSAAEFARVKAAVVALKASNARHDEHVARLLWLKDHTPGTRTVA